MQIGILNADDLTEEIIQEYGDYAEMFKNLLLSVDDTLSFSTYQVAQYEYPSSVDECDAYLLTGSRFSAYDDEAWIKQLEVFIVKLYQHQKKLIGICFGHQLIAQALGGKVENSEKGWGLGVISSDVKQAANRCNWLKPEKNSFSLLVSHQDQVVELPPRAKLVASNAFCPNAAFQIDESVLTFQGHPEFSVDYVRYIMNKQRETIGEENYAQAQSTLKQARDHNLVARWLLNFIV